MNEICHDALTVRQACRMGWVNIGVVGQYRTLIYVCMQWIGSFRYESSIK